jgi:hypothetical protein
VRDNGVVATSTQTRPTRPDPGAAAAVDLARAAAVEVAGDQVGDHLGVSADGERVVTHTFAATARGYRGWHWAVTLARAPRAKTVTVDEVVLLPGDGALLAPPWVPWSQRLRAGDIGAGDLLPVAADDPRLVPGYVGNADAGAHDLDVDPFAWAVVEELFLGRSRVLSSEGRDEASERWFEGPQGPDDPVAEAAPAHCVSCGFLIPMAGALRAAFGVCANAYSPADGRVVALGYGCGGHSDVVETESNFAAPVGAVYEDEPLDIVATPPVG